MVRQRKKSHEVESDSKEKSIETSVCPGCGHHCPLSSPRCGKGRAYAKKLQESQAISQDGVTEHASCEKRNGPAAAEHAHHEKRNGPAAAEHAHHEKRNGPAAAEHAHRGMHSGRGGCRKADSVNDASFGLQDKILKILSRKGQVSQRHLQKKLEISAPVLEQELTALEAAGHIQRKRDPENSQKVWVCLAQSGQECEKMEQGFWYDANFDPGLRAKRQRANELCFLFNQVRPKEEQRQRRILRKLLGECGTDTEILAPLYADYGYRTQVGDHTFINHGAYLMDGGGIQIGSHCFIGPNCGMYTAAHPLVAQERDQGLEQARPIVIGDHVWIGGNVTILPGVHIGSYAVIGAGSVVTGDVPERVVAVGNPCRVMRELTEQDKILPEQKKTD